MNIKNFFEIKKSTNNATVINDEKRQISQKKNVTNNHHDGNLFANFEIDATDDKAHDLMVLVGKAIDCWAKMYSMEDLPKHIIFKQALGIMNAWNNIYKQKD